MKAEGKDGTAQFSRRRFLFGISALGVASTTFNHTLLAQAEEKGVLELADLKAAEKLAGIAFTDEERKMMLADIEETIKSYDAIRKLNISNQVSPALQFVPIPAPTGSKETGENDPPQQNVSRPAESRELSFMPLHKLAELIRTKQISVRELTKFYLKKLEKENEVLECVISLTTDRALKQAGAADKDIASGNYHGPLHGIPWGAKDLLAVKGYKTTWGATPYKEQIIDEDATVVSKLDQAGAILIAKLTLGALAWGDVWFGGKTRNPWNLEQGSSGSSAGSASATAAGCLGFALGSETWGSIVSPSTICGTSGLRPTFGRVSKTGAMALSWSMDKLGPICRSVEDCAYVFSAIHGADGKDISAVDYPFTWKREIDPKKIKIGYLKSDFEAKREEEEEWREFDQRTLNKLEKMGYTLVPISLPEFPVEALSFILNAEAAAAFDELTMSNRDDLLVRQVRNAWPNTFRQSRYIPAVEYIQANRARTMLIQKMNQAIKDVDVYMSPSWVGSNLLLTNLTGHPAVVLPNGFRKDGTPTSITFNGHLFGEEVLLAVANAYQQETDFHLQHPDIDSQRGNYKNEEKK